MGARAMTAPLVAIKAGLVALASGLVGFALGWICGARESRMPEDFDRHPWGM